MQHTSRELCAFFAKQFEGGRRGSTGGGIEKGSRVERVQIRWVRDGGVVIEAEADEAV